MGTQEYEAVLSTSSHEDENARLRRARAAARESKKAKLKVGGGGRRKASGDSLVRVGLWSWGLDVIGMVVI